MSRYHRPYPKDPDPLPDPPFKPEEIEATSVPVKPHRTSIVGFMLAVALVFGLVAVIVWSLNADDGSPVGDENPAFKPPNPCGHDTFDPNACATKMVTGASQASGAPIDATRDAICEAYTPRKDQRRLIASWVADGAYEKEALAVLGVLLQHCGEEVKV